MAAALAVRLGVTHLELDSVIHQRDWRPLAPEAFRRRIDEFTALGGWVIDGNYRAVRDLIWGRADTVIWLDLPRHVVTRQIIGRSVRRVWRNEELWNGNRERWRNLLSLNPERSVIVWSVTRHRHYRRQYGDLFSDPATGDRRMVRLRSRRQIRDFLAESGTAGGAARPDSSSGPAAPEDAGPGVVG